MDRRAAALAEAAGAGRVDALLGTSIRLLSHLIMSDGTNNRLRPERFVEADDNDKNRSTNKKPSRTLGVDKKAGIRRWNSTSQPAQGERFRTRGTQAAHLHGGSADRLRGVSHGVCRSRRKGPRTKRGSEGFLWARGGETGHRLPIPTGRKSSVGQS